MMNKNILLIDDDEDEQLIFSEALKDINVSVNCFCAITVEEGIKFLRQLLPDFIFLDVNMPVLNGLECLDIIKKDEQLKAIPVIMYSTGMNDKISKLALRKGAFACLKKTNSISDLASMLKKLF